tara:strand:- start:1843 stop:2403 length:561 start_codon:yes stop_codon:yes gene_type:complete
MTLKFTRKTLQTNNNNTNTRPRNGRILQPPQNHQQKQGQMIWGRATWLFLHTLAHKIKEESFINIRKQLLDFIVSICNLLPCPICRNHADNYIKNVNFNTIQTKQDLKYMLFTFHNSVNSNKNLPIFPYGKLDSTYENSNLINATNYFFLNFKHNGFMKAVVENNRRNQLKIQIQKWLHENSRYFN